MIGDGRVDPLWLAGIAPLLRAARTHRIARGAAITDDEGADEGAGKRDEAVED
ncbi:MULTISPECIES: hypothetical protein [Catenuloplanes]|uniref:Uncharacterized protein n=1 Tax=Catenuloplanes niger TaxID=587534 RepID=A0AAE4CRW7_9ACTN|nr:hypothetical protein [Catenuloplanes niger]MDR7320563.1 hypothetical protein [Catenuloplanes niger]